MYFQPQRRVLFEGYVAEPPQSVTAIFPVSECTVLPLRIVMQDALSAAWKVYPRLKLKGFVDDMKLHV